MKRILLTGAQGQVGQELLPVLSPLAEVVAVDRTQLDLTQPDAIRQMVLETQPALIVNAAAYTAVDKAESDRETATAVNGIAPTVLAETAQTLGATFIHISTDYVFDGSQNLAYTESDPTRPLGVYGETKLQGEIGIRQACDRHIILRTAWVYGTQGKGNFVKTMLRLGADREELRVVADQIGTPTWAKDIALAIAKLSAAHLQSAMQPALVGGGSAADNAIDTLPIGTFHFTNSGVASWYDFAVAIFEEAKRLDWPLKIDRVVPITAAEYPTPAQRPAFSVLDRRKWSAWAGAHPPHWRQSLRAMLSELSEHS
ncbi:dTDP-4-dehydrorhamnose reductase [Microcoleus sp. FACHB-1515]|uniref:dTDP-4-dehydrorhamnose reductase n=1 Tax=Cyanophyceae TaxID=3028117 RepID=UPI0016887683|nr:dTDP-4-dehydrorhamnose reductase [Microcoleus sp. FACHB-1515]MBD2089491.1 dTDP-4-dehydrorhamnose reductase [Microcoleus sp. FACHB-1515]